MAANREKYRLYHLHLFAEVMIEEMSELMRSGVSPIGLGYVMPINKDQREKLHPILEKTADRIRETTEMIIEESASSSNETDTSEEWMRMMLEELKMRVSTIGDVYALELKDIVGLINEIEDILTESNRTDKKK